MSWRIDIDPAVGPEQLGPAVRAAGGQLSPEEREQVELAAALAAAAATGGRLGAGPFLASATGHANLGHQPAADQPDEYLTLALQSQAGTRQSPGQPSPAPASADRASASDGFSVSPVVS